MFMIGIEIYCAPTAEAREVWRASMTHIALEGSCFVLSANQFCRRKDCPLPPKESTSGDSNGDASLDTVLSSGGSLIVSPSGTILAGPNYQGESLISADLGILIPQPHSSLSLTVSSIHTFTCISVNLDEFCICFQILVRLLERN